MVDYYFYTQPGIGDNIAAHGQDFPVLRTFGVLKSIKAKEPDSTITCCVSAVYNGSTLEIIELNPYIDEFIVGPEWVSNNLTWEFQNRDNFFKNIVKEKVGIEDSRVSMSFDYEQCPIYVSKGDAAVAYYLYNFVFVNAKVIGIHTGSGKVSGGDFKHWPFERWRQLVSVLISCGYKVVQFGSISEVNIPGAFNMTGFSIRQQLCVLKALSFFVGTDSAFKSAGYLYRVPTVVLWPAHKDPEIKRQQLCHNHWRNGEQQIKLLECSVASDINIETVIKSLKELERVHK